MGILRLEMLPAAEGDALLIEWGRNSKPHRMLVDAGPLTTYKRVRGRIAALGIKPRLELLVVTHNDGDHIEGVIRLLQDRRAAQAWSRRHLVQRLGPAAGKRHARREVRRDGRRAHCPRQAPVQQTTRLRSRGRDPRGRSASVLSTRDGARLTVLGPGTPELRKLKANWISALKDEEDIRPGDTEAALKALAENKRLRGLEGPDVQGGAFKPDSSVANLSSICLLFEYDDRALLLTGDSHSAPLVTAIERLLGERGEERLRVDAFKLPHHCSRANVSGELVALVDTPRYLESTSGARHGHPDKEAVLRVLDTPHRDGHVQLVFNYLSKTTKPWAKPTTVKKYGYTPVFPESDAGGVVVEVRD